jgi:hypothetical protein
MRAVCFYSQNNESTVLQPSEWIRGRAAALKEGDGRSLDLVNGGANQYLWAT